MMVLKVYLVMALLMVQLIVFALLYILDIVDVAIDRVVND